MLDFYELFVDDNMIQLLTTETNRYAQQQRQLHPSNLPWTDVTDAEMKAFLGVNIAMGIANLKRLADYWSTEPITSIPWYSTIFSRTRFLQILRYLHCNNNDDQLPRDHASFDKLFKVRPVLERVQEKCKTVYTCEREISVDEQLVGTRCRIGFLQYMPAKPTKWGIKLWVLAEASSGFVGNFQVYTGAADGAVHGLSHRVVYDLLQPRWLNHGYSVFTDNFYTSPQLCRDLLSDNTYLTGTVRPNRRFFPDDIKLNNMRMDRGDTAFRHSDGIMAVRWKDKRDVFLMSSSYDNTMQQVPQVRGADQNEVRMKPLSVLAYNENMAGVDRCDQLLCYYTVGRKTLKWWRRLFWRLIEIGIVNAFRLYQKKHGKRKDQDQKWFRQKLVHEIVDTFVEQRAAGGDARPGPGRPRTPGVDRLTGRHKIVTRSRGRCKVCAKQKKEDGKCKDTKTANFCETCNVHVCRGQCEQMWHSRAVLRRV